jgi:uncharacterized repeat protein (TIGR03943 family)
MKKIGALLEGLVLVALAVYVGVLVLAGEYWRFLNPKFKWLTGATAVLLLVTGAIAVWKPHRRPRLSRLIVFLLFFRFLTMGMSGSVSYVKGFAAVFGGSAPAAERSRVVMNGREYIRINLGELYQLGQRREPEQVAQAYVVQGKVMKSRVLDEAGQFALMRVAVFCCMADALAMGFRVQAGPAAELVDGQWIEVYGTLKRQTIETDPGIRIPGMFLSVVSETNILVPVRIIPIKEPAIPFMFEFRKAEPYAN